MGLNQRTIVEYTNDKDGTKVEVPDVVINLVKNIACRDCDHIHKITLIKHVRTTLGLGLYDAKEIVCRLYTAAGAGVGRDW